MTNKITTIALTGGPCAGKTTICKRLKENLPKYGINVFVVSEVATDLAYGGVSLTQCKDDYFFQFNVIRLQLQKEEMFKQAALTMDKEKSLIICDRGVFDVAAYLPYDVFLSFLPMHESKARKNYDAVFHLVTAAKDMPEKYHADDTTVRKDTLEESISLDNRFLHAWQKHGDVTIFDNRGGFDEKYKRIEKEILNIMDKRCASSAFKTSSNNFDSAYDDVIFLKDYSYDGALIGISEDRRAIYDYEKMVEWLMNETGWDEKDACDWISCNTIRALPYAGEKSPIIMYPTTE